MTREVLSDIAWNYELAVEKARTWRKKTCDPCFVWHTGVLSF